MIYFDNAATTKPCVQAAEAAENAMKHAWGNPSSLHKIGIEAQKLTDAARKNAAVVTVQRRSNVFSCGIRKLLRLNADFMQ